MTMNERDDASTPGRVTFHSPRYLLHAGRQRSGSRRALPQRSHEQKSDQHVDPEPGGTQDVHRSESLGEQPGADHPEGEGSPRLETERTDDNEGTPGPSESQVEASDSSVGTTPSERIQEEDEQPEGDDAVATGTPDTARDEPGTGDDQVASDEAETYGGYGAHPALCGGSQGFVYHPWLEVESTTDGEL